MVSQGNKREAYRHASHNNNLSERRRILRPGEKVKAEFLRGGPKLLKLIEDSVYDTKHVHCSSMVSEEFNLVVKEK